MRFCQGCGSKLTALESPEWTLRFRCEAHGCGTRYEVRTTLTQDRTYTFDQPFTDVAEVVEGAVVPVLAPELKVAVVHAVTDLQDAVHRLLSLYEANAHLNDLQPDSFSTIIPMSLDEWYLAVIGCVEDWKKVG